MSFENDLVFVDTEVEQIGNLIEIKSMKEVG